MDNIDYFGSYLQGLQRFIQFNTTRALVGWALRFRSFNASAKYSGWVVDLASVPCDRSGRGIRQQLILIYMATAGGFPGIPVRNGSKEHGVDLWAMRIVPWCVGPR